jgi:glycosyltransferase involved in cell wall biosynthesis
MKISEMPLVSCIMPTCNRRAFVPHAIQYFLQQDYQNKELVIVDDGSDCIKDLVPDNERIRYIRLQKKMTLGEKRNYCIRESHGDLIMHWDDDDWMASYRISYQVKELLLHNAEVCGLQEMFFREIENGNSWLYKYPANARPWLAGGSLLYTKDFWKRSPFPDTQVASDTSFHLPARTQVFCRTCGHQFLRGQHSSAKHQYKKNFRFVLAFGRPSHCGKHYEQRQYSRCDSNNYEG